MILIVDDELNIRLIFKDFLSKEGYSCFLAANGREALNFFESNKEIKLVICDLRMPDINGLKLLQHFRKLYPGRHTQFIMISGLNDVNSIRLSFKEGALDYLTKPVDLDELLRTSKEALDRYQNNCAIATQRQEGQQLLISYKLLRKRYIQLVSWVIKGIVLHDDLSRYHNARVLTMVEIIAERLVLTQEEKTAIKLGAVLHDLGKYIPSGLLDPHPNKDLSADDTWKSSRLVNKFIGQQTSQLIYTEPPFSLGYQIIKLVKNYDRLRKGSMTERPLGTQEALEKLQLSIGEIYEEEVFKVFLNISGEIEEKIYNKKRV